MVFNIKKLREIKKLLHKGHKEDAELHKVFIEPYKAYKDI
jgi:formiminotetrahydrofolate cyclodeaminase